MSGGVIRIPRTVAALASLGALLSTAIVIGLLWSAAGRPPMVQPVIGAVAWLVGTWVYQGVREMDLVEFFAGSADVGVKEDA